MQNYEWLFYLDFTHAHVDSRIGHHQVACSGGQINHPSSYIFRYVR